MKGRVFTSLADGSPVSGNLYGSSVSTAVAAGFVAGVEADGVVAAVSGVVVGRETGVSLQPTMVMTEQPRTSQALSDLCDGIGTMISSIGTSSLHLLFYEMYMLGKREIEDF